MPQILVVDDEVGIRELLSEILVDEGYTVSTAANANAARLARNELRPDLVLLDIWMPDMDGISLLKEWKANGQLNMPVIVMSGHATIDTAVEATRIGAVDFLEKPIALQKLLGTVKHAMRHSSISSRLQLSLGALTRSVPMREVKKRLEQIARGSRIISLKGIFGGVAELVARTLLGPQRPWLDISRLTSPISHDQLQNLQGGIVFCPDLGGLSKMQGMNLSFTLDRLEKFDLCFLFGSSRSVSGTELAWDVSQIRRLLEINFCLPNLSRCQDDIPDIAALLLSYMVETLEVPSRQFSAGALNRLRLSSWEDEGGGWMTLYAAIRNLALSCLNEEISDEDARSSIERAEANPATATSINHQQMTWFSLPLREAREAFEKSYFEHLLNQENGNMTKVAERSGLERTHLYRKLKQLSVHTKKRPEEN